MTENSYICHCCGKEHAGIPFSFAADYPDPYANLSTDQRELRAVIGCDQCIIDQEKFFLRVCLEIPIQDTGEVFLWGLWALVKQKDFDEIADHRETKGRERRIGPYRARLANSVSLYSETFNLPVTVRIKPVDERPVFLVDDENHPLSTEQKKGISMVKAQEYACTLLRIGESPQNRDLN
jgi:hypothetical protein